VTANPGTNGTQAANGAAGTGGTGSANTTHPQRGQRRGRAVSHARRRRRGSAGVSLAGNNASGATGGAAVTSGGKGGTAHTGSSGGVGGDIPGGGGAGGKHGAAGTPQSEVGRGGDGRIYVTYTTTVPQFSTLIAHSPGPDASDNLNPLITLDPLDIPDGTIEYPVPSLIDGMNADFAGTYTLALVNFAWNTPSASRKVTVTVKQYE